MKQLITFIIILVCGFSLEAKNLTVFNVVPALEGNEKERAEDVIRIEKERIADMSLLLFTLVPEGNPPIDKFGVLSKRYEKLRDAIDGRAKLGILLQATIGHGYVLKNENNLEHFVRIVDLKENKYRCCPLGEGVIKYMQDICRKSAQLKPDHIMIDDDFRMYTSRGNAGCLCPLHLKKISEKLGREISAEEAQAHLFGTSEENKRVTKIIDEVIIDSICALAQKMRDAIDEVDPKIRGSVCVCADDIRYAERLGKIFAGKGYEPIIRINNARYASANVTPRTFAHTMYSSVQQMAPIKDVGIIIAETDTLPHNRYGTSARSLHANYCGYIFEKCQGSKQWITLTSEFEPNGNEAYRKILAEHADFYETLAGEIKNVVSSRGFAVLIPETQPNNFNPFISGVYGSIKTWAQNYLVNSGLPVNFEYVGKNAGLINSSDLRLFSDAEIKKQLAKAVALDSGAAVELCKRGFGKYLGVNASFYGTHDINAEIITDDPINGSIKGKLFNGTNGELAKLELTSSKTRVLSNFACKKFSQDDKANFKISTPACTIFENELGGKVIVYASKVGGLDGWNTYTRYPRKTFILQALNSVSPFRIWYPYDAEMYVKSLTQKDGSELVGLFNFGWDPLEQIELAFSEKPKSVDILQKNGKWQKVDFSTEGNLLKIKQKLEPMYPVVLKLNF